MTDDLYKDDLYKKVSELAHGHNEWMARVRIAHERSLLRDHFAGLAMQALIGKYAVPINELVSEKAYEFADAMLKERDAMLKEREKKQ